MTESEFLNVSDALFERIQSALDAAGAEVESLLQGNVLPAAAQAAAVFVADCLKATPDEADERLGVWLESVLPQLMQNPE